MLTLNSRLRIPAHVSFSVVGEDAFLLNTRTNKYFSLAKVGARLWELLNAGSSLQDGFLQLSAEYDVSPARLENDILELVRNLAENELVEIVQD
ncbi:MAG: PqqD family protein [Chloroflexi bacterium]|nr:PqqD family protein [Chloroflexota bacterium]